MRRTKQQLLPLVLPDGLVLGGLVRYFHGGWRAGYLDSVKNKTAWIRPIGAGDGERNRIAVLLEDVRTIQSLTKGDNATSIT